MNNIIRITRHAADEVQTAELRRIYGHDAKIVLVSENLPNAPQDAVARFDEIAADAAVVEVVLPVNLLEAVLKFSAFSKRGGVIIRAVMERTLVDKTPVFAFARYERVMKVEIVTESL